MITKRCPECGGENLREFDRLTVGGRFAVGGGMSLLLVAIVGGLLDMDYRIGRICIAGGLLLMANAYFGMTSLADRCADCGEQGNFPFSKDGSEAS